MKHPFLPFFLLYCLCHVPSHLYGQQILQGIVTNLDNEPLPFVNILINDSQTRGVSTDIDGKFYIEVSDAVFALTFSYVGYETQRINVQKAQGVLEIRMNATAIGIEEIVVIAGENPADIIIRKAVKNRRRNHPENLDSYQCKTYNKVVFTLTPAEEEFKTFIAEKDTSKRYYRRYHDNMFKMIEKSKEHHLFIMESVTQRNYQSPGQAREIVQHNRVSGFKKAEFSALVNDIQPFSFYDEQLDILDKTFLNPISRGSTRQYFFHLKDSLYQDQDTIFIIQFHPRKGKNFEGLSGVLYIHSNGHAVQNVIAEPADTSFIQLRIEQQYALAENRQWFPEQLNFVLHAKKYPTPFLGTKVYGKSYIDSVLINPDLDKKLFKHAEQIIFQDNANTSSDSIWQSLRKEDLDTLEINTYRIVDEQGTKLKLDKRLDQLEALSSGRWPVGVVDLSLTDVLAFNDFESTRLGLGLYTNDQISKIFSLGGYAGYGLKDKAWKYGGSLKIELWEPKQTKLQFFYQKDVLEPAVANFSLSPQLVSRRFLAQRMDEIETVGTVFHSRLFKYLTVEAKLQQQIIRPFGEYQYIGEPFLSFYDGYRFSEVEVGFRYALREDYITFLGVQIPEPTPFPVLEMHYTRGFRDFLNGDFDYHKILLSVNHQFSLKRFGETRYRFEAGWLDRSLPLAKLYNSSGFGRDFQFLTIGHSFQTMDRYEFLSDQFIHFFFAHNFGTRLLKAKNFKPEFNVVHNMAYGALSNPEHHWELDFKTLEKGYFESGLVVENLIRVNYFNFLYIGAGLGAYYRYGPYALPAFKDNWAFRLALSFSY